jgi:hypothetical protein
MAEKISVKEFNEWFEEHGTELLEYDYDDLNDEEKKIVDDFLSKELDVELGELKNDTPLYNVFYTYEGEHEYFGTTNNFKVWLASLNKDRVDIGETLFHEDDFTFSAIDLSIFKEDEDEQSNEVIRRRSRTNHSKKPTSNV